MLTMVSTRLALKSCVMIATPVRLPAGRARLAPKPLPTGSVVKKTIGVVEVTRFASWLATPPMVTNVDLQANQVGNRGGVPILGARVPLLDAEISALHITSLPHRLSKHRQVRLDRGNRDPTDLNGRVTFGEYGQRPRYRSSHDTAKDGSAIDHAIPLADRRCRESSAG